MALRTIITPENPVLRKKAHKVTRVDDPKLQTLIDDMVETMLDAPGVGLAAPQVEVTSVHRVRLLTTKKRSRSMVRAGRALYADQSGAVRVSDEMVDGMKRVSRSLASMATSPPPAVTVQAWIAVYEVASRRKNGWARFPARDRSLDGVP
jgi:hypothetical protein